MTKLLLLSLCIFSVKYANAQEIGTSQSFDDFYTVNEADQKSVVDMNPAQALQDVLGSDGLSELKAQVYNLLKLDHHQENFGGPTEPYKRVQHFGTWIHGKSDSDCLNTRGKVLVRDSSVKTELNSAGCTVIGGEWLDPYTDGKYQKASDIQIDHVVPLKNAYQNGAWKWDFKKRCLYGNFLANDFHLLSVMGHENMKKGDKGPEGYMPPAANFKCEYLQNWLKIKLIWQLHLTDDEEKAVSSLVEENHCDTKAFTYKASDVKTQRTFMVNNADICGK